MPEPDPADMVCLSRRVWVVVGGEGVAVTVMCPFAPSAWSFTRLLPTGNGPPCVDARCCVGPVSIGSQPRPLTSGHLPVVGCRSGVSTNASPSGQYDSEDLELEWTWRDI